MIDKFSQNINDILLPAVKKFIVENRKKKFMASEAYRGYRGNKAELIFEETKKIYLSLNKLSFSFYTGYALRELIERERRIRDFAPHEYYKVWAMYRANGIEFIAYYPMSFDKSSFKEMEDLIADLGSNQYEHIVDSYTPKEKEKDPPEPITTAQLQFSAFYVYNLQPHETMDIAMRLYKVGLITHPITDGWHIDDESVEQMITLLNSLYGEANVLQYKRKYGNKDGEREQEAIRPTSFDKAFSPEKVSESNKFKDASFTDKEKRIALNLYEYIYCFTLATQMTSSRYDTSTLQIAVGQRILKETANSILDYENEDGKKISMDGWEKIAGKLFRQRESAIDGIKEKVVVLPQLASGDKLESSGVKFSSISAKRPPRFGIGRYIVQILERNKIGEPAIYSDIVQSLVDAKLCSIVGKIINPNENAILAYDWLEQFCPDLTKYDRMTDYLDKCAAVFAEELTEKSVISEFIGMLENAVENSGYVADSTPPSEAKIKLIKGIAHKHKVDLPNLQDSADCDRFLRQYPPEEYKLVGYCPACNANVQLREWASESGEVSHYFNCERRNTKDGCTFSIWDSDVKRFFSDKAHELYTLEDRIAMVTKILSKQRNKERGFRLDGLVAQNKKEYSARIFFESYVDKKTQKVKWGFGMDFINSRGGR